MSLIEPRGAVLTPGVLAAARARRKRRAGPASRKVLGHLVDQIPWLARAIDVAAAERNRESVEEDGSEAAKAVREITQRRDIALARELAQRV